MDLLVLTTTSTAPWLVKTCPLLSCAPLLYDIFLSVALVSSHAVCSSPFCCLFLFRSLSFLASGISLVFPDQDYASASPDIPVRPSSNATCSKQHQHTTLIDQPISHNNTIPLSHHTTRHSLTQTTYAKTTEMAGGKGKSSGGKSSGGKVGADGSKKQQSHSSKAGLQVSPPQPASSFIARLLLLGYLGRGEQYRRK